MVPSLESSRRERRHHHPCSQGLRIWRGGVRGAAGWGIRHKRYCEKSTKKVSWNLSGEKPREHLVMGKRLLTRLLKDGWMPSCGGLCGSIGGLFIFTESGTNTSICWKALIPIFCELPSNTADHVLSLLLWNAKRSKGLWTLLLKPYTGTDYSTRSSCPLTVPDLGALVDLDSTQGMGWR